MPGQKSLRRRERFKFLLFHSGRAKKIIWIPQILSDGFLALDKDYFPPIEPGNLK